MEMAYRQAELAAERGEVPVGAVLVKDRKIIAADGNRTRELNDPTAHAEILTIRAATAYLETERLEGSDLYVTLEPCTMCAAAISYARIRRLYYGASDPKSGGIEQGARFFEQTTCHHAPELYSGLMETRCSQLLKTFFKSKRTLESG